MSEERKVDFLIAGVQKGGTSALFEYLNELSGLALPAIKEAHHFDDEETVDWSRPDHRRYHALFGDRPGLWGEATPIYLYWPQCLERIRAYNPAMKLILLFRDPIARAFSHWQMEFAKGKEQHPFAWCIREGCQRVATGDPAAPGHHRVFSYVERGFYGRQVERLFALFPPSQCLLLRSEDLRDDPATIIAAICAFLGVSPPATPAAPRIVHRAREISYPSALTEEDKRWLARQYQPEMASFEKLSGLSTEPWVKYWPI